MPVLLMFYKRHLPHWQKNDSALFITWRLHGSLPRRVIDAIRKESDFGKRFRIFDRELDRSLYDPMWLKDVRLASIVSNSLIYAEEDLGFYRLCAYVVMSNHVHILVWPNAYLPRITKSLKGYTARECNKLLSRTGEHFWQDESFDHAVRNEDEFWRIKRYIENNPVKAGLVKAKEQWSWSSAAGKRSEDRNACLR